MNTYAHLWDYIADFFLEWEIVETVEEKIKTHIICPKIFSENRAVYDVMLKNMVKSERP
jgi:hypothetical protein